MFKNKKTGVILLFTVGCLMLMQLTVQAEEPGKNIVFAAGETWGTYAPANYDYPWPNRPVKTDVTSVGPFNAQGCIFYNNRWIDGNTFGTPQWSWMAGRHGMDFGHGLLAVEYNPGDEFAQANTGQVDAGNEHYAYLKWVPTVAGADDPARNYHDPEGGAHLSEDRSHAWGTAAWPTTVGVDVKMTVHSWTLPWGHLDDFHLVEIELTNTGQPDLDGDGVVDFEGNRINALNFLYWPGCFHFRILTNGRRSYYVNNNRYRGTIIDQTPDENGAPWDIYCQAIGSKTTEANDHPAITDWGEYYDAWNGYGYLGAKKWNPDTQQWEEKFLAFKDANGNEVVPAVGEGQQRGWFRTSQPGWNDVWDGSERKAHISSMGCFYVDGGKSNAGTNFDLNPNPAIFASGTEGDPTTFVVKDKSQWTYPDGAWEKAKPVMVVDPVSGKQLGINPIDPSPGRGHAMEPNIITEGLVSQYQFDGDPICGLGPLALEVGEKIRVYYYRGSGFRILGLRKTVKAARAVFESIQSDGSYVVPQAPPVPDIKIGLSENIKAVVKFQDPSGLGDADGVKIFKSRSWPRYKSTEKLYPTHDTWWKTMDPDVDPGKAELNPLLDVNSELLREQQADFWGPYELAKVIPKSEYSNYPNSGSDKGDYPYAWEDETTTPGFSYYYYVSSYKEGAAASVPIAYQNLDNTTWLESGKVNTNGRTGHWENTWPWAWQTSDYPTASDVAGLKDLGAVFVLVTPPVSISDIESGSIKIGVRPNPYKRVAFHDLTGEHKLLFYNLPPRCTIQIFDLAGMLVDQIEYQTVTSDNGTYFWDMFSQNGNEVASGLYIWVVKYEGGMKTGHLAIIK